MSSDREMTDAEWVEARPKILRRILDLHTRLALAEKVAEAGWALKKARTDDAVINAIRDYNAALAAWREATTEGEGGDDAEAD